MTEKGSVENIYILMDICMGDAGAGTIPGCFWYIHLYVKKNDDQIVGWVFQGMVDSAAS